MTIQFNDPKHELQIIVVMAVIHYDTTKRIIKVCQIRIG